MKTRIVVPADTKPPLWRQPSEKTQCLLDRVKKLTRELHAMHSELVRELAEDDRVFRNQSPVAGDLNELKTAADEIRRVLWLCLEKIPESDQPQVSADHPRQHGRYQAGRWLAEQTDLPAIDLEPGSFFERLNLAIEGHMQNRGISPRDKRMKS